MGIKKRVFRVAFIASTVPIIFITIITFFIFSNKLLENENKEIRKMNQTLRLNITNHLETSKKIILYLKNIYENKDKSLTKQFGRVTPELRLQNLISHMEDISTIETGMNVLGVVTKDKKAYIDNIVGEQSDKNNFDPTKRIWYTGAEQSETVYVSGIFKRISTGEPIVTISSKVEVDGVVEGVIAAIINFKFINEMISHEKIGKNGSYFLVDKNHQIIEDGGDNQNNLELLLKNNITLKDNQELTLKGENGNRIFYIHSLDNMELYLIGSVDESDLMSEVYLLRNYAIGIILFTIFSTIFALLFLSRVFDRSLHRLELIINSIANGNYRKDVKKLSQIIDEKNELNFLKIALEKMSNQVIRREDDLKLISETDPLTNISNRRAILSSIEKAISNFEEYNITFCLIMFDLDSLKNINDTYGHLFGDRVLMRITSIISDEIRGDDRLGRYGGDEFLLLLPKTKILSGIEVAERIRKRIENLEWEYEINITVSCGIVEVRKRDSLNCLLKRVDSFLYIAKKNGKNIIASRNKVDNENNLKIIKQDIEYVNKTLEYDILQGIEKKEFEVYYQPKVDLLNKKIEFEGLMRWNHKELGVLGADTFIPLAEENSLILALSTYLIEKIKEDTKKLKTKVSLNLSLSHFNNSFFLEKLLNDTIDLENIEFEITEEFFSGDSDKSLEKINFLNELGFKFLIDDFGTGYSSLYRLANLPITTLKIDRCFVQNMFKSEKDMILLEAIINLGNRLNLKVIVEGVENKEEVEHLKKLGVYLFQGYYFGRPEPIEVILENLEKGVYIEKI